MEWDRVGAKTGEHFLFLERHYAIKRRPERITVLYYCT